MDSSSTPVVTILGAGMYGSAIAVVASHELKNKVILYTKEASVVEDVNKNHKNSKYYSDIVFNENVTATLELEEAVKNSSIIVSAIPVQGMVDVIQNLKKIGKLDVPFVSCSKGMIASQCKFISEYFTEVFGEGLKYAVLSGPSFAEEIILKHPTLVVVASKDHSMAVTVQKILSNKFFRIYTQTDVIGVEIAGALKNVMAIGAGIVEGFGYGSNTKTALIARGSKEIQTFALSYGAKPETLFGLAGIGDLMLTCYGSLSRNRTCGYKIAQGKKLEEIVTESKGVIEGLPTLDVVYGYAKKKGIVLPITEVIYEIVHGIVGVEEAADKIMTRELEPEFPFAQI